MTTAAALATTALTPVAPAPGAPAAAPAPAPVVAKDAAGLLYGDPDPVAPSAPAPAAPPAPAPDEPPADGPSAPAPDDAADGDAISTLAELIEQNEFDPAWFNGLKVDVKVDGQTTAVPMSELVKSYQISEAAVKRLEDAKTRAATITSEANAQRDAVQVQLSSVAALLKHAEAELDREVAAIDWGALRERDPAEWTAKKTEVAERRERLKTIKDQGAQTFRDAMKAHSEASNVALEQQLVTSRAALKEAIPEWGDMNVAKSEMTQIENFLTTSRGFTVDEIRGTIDHRLLVLARDAWIGQKVSSADPSKKLVRNIPKRAKPAGGAPPVPQAKSAVDVLYKN